MFAGHLGELSLSGASIAASFANVTGFSVLVRTVVTSLHSAIYATRYHCLCIKSEEQGEM
jgi:hypothetical protein